MRLGFRSILLSPMPYPVSLPEPPAIVSPFAEDVAQSSRSTPVAQGRGTATPSSQSENLAPPELPQPEFSSSEVVASSARSRASLLGAPLTVGIEGSEAESPQFASPTPEFNPTNQVPVVVPSTTPSPSVSRRVVPQPSNNPRSPIRPLPRAGSSENRRSTSPTPEAWLQQVIPPNSRPAKPGTIAQIRNETPIIEIPATPPPPGTPNTAPTPSPDDAQPDNVPTSQPPTPTTPPQSPAPTDPKQPAPAASPPPNLMPGIIELTADRQEYDERRRIFTAEGNVVMRYQGSVLDADRLQVNLLNRVAVAEGNVALTRGEQVLRGQRFEYNFTQETGTVFNASGELFLTSATSDFNPGLANDPSTGTVLGRPLSDRLTANQPLTQVSSTGGVTVIAGSRRNVGNIPLGQSGGQVNRLRYEAERIDFGPRQSQATNVRITNDPFSPPELELRTPQATFTRLSPLRDEIRATRPRLVFDQGFSLPLLRNRIVLDRRERDPALVQFGFDDEDRGGLFVQRTFEPIRSDRVRLTITPQFFVQKAVQDGFDASAFGVRTRFDATLGPRTNFLANATLTSFDADEIRDQLRARVRLTQLIGASALAHNLGLEYTYRERIFNGSLGFRTVQSSIGAVLNSPVIPLGRSGITLSYQAGIQNIEAETDRADLLAPIRDNNRVNLTRYQANVALNRGFLLWSGKPLPATATEGLRYTPNPVVPYISLGVGVRGTLSGYSNGDSQNLLIGGIGLSGQFGNFSRRFLDYTGFNISYSEIIGEGQSPFLFDRAVDDRVLSFGLVQQLYGPFRIGFQTSINLETNESISTDYFLEYSRRTYGILLRFNPVLEIGSLSLRISDFNWNGGTEPFDGTDVRPVEAGVER